MRNIFLFFLSIFSAGPIHSDEHWIVKKDALQSIEVLNEVELIALLSDLGIQVEPCSSTEDWKKNADFVPPPTRLTAETIWEGETVQILLSPTRHLYLSPLRKVSRLEELCDDEVIEMHLLAAKLDHVFQQVFGVRGYVEHIPNGKNSGQIGEQLYAEIFPAGPVEECDLLTKIRRISFFLSNGQYGDISLSQEQVEAIKTAAAPLLSSPLDAPLATRRKNGTEWARLSKNHLAAAKQASQILLSMLQDAGSAYFLFTDDEKKPSIKELQSLQTEDELGSREMVVVKECAFCKPSVIERQRVLQGRQMDILYNYSPFVLFRHFMIVSHDHVENRADLSNEEILEEHRQILQVGNYFSETFNSPDYKVWMQSGMLAGQTVMHHHCHVVSGTTHEMQRWLVMAVCWLLGRKDFFATDAQMADTKENFHRFLISGNPQE